MAPPSFKLGHPAQPRSLDVAEVPRWLEDHFAVVNSNNDAKVLGTIDTAVLKGAAFDEVNSNSKLNQPESTSVCSQSGGGLQLSFAESQSSRCEKFWENTEAFASNSCDITSADDRRGRFPERPKNFCDNLYLRLINILFLISDEKQAAMTQLQIEKFVEELERQVLR